MSRRAAPVLATLAAAALLGGCKEVEPEGRAVYEPSSVHEVAGAKTKQVTFTQRGADEVGLALATSGRKAGFTTVPYAALMYDGNGLPWVYVSQKALTFQRVQVVVARVEGDEVQISHGLAPGTKVVTVGAAEVYGTELGIAGKH